MKIIHLIKLSFICALTISLVACNNSATSISTAKGSTKAMPAVKSSVNATAVAANTTAKTKSSKIASAPSTIEKPVKRSVDEMEMNFPYDVTVMDAEGNKVNTRDILNNGKPTAILFWLTTCGPCKMKFAAIDKKYAQWKEETDFDMVAISVDWPKNTQRFRDMVTEKDWPWPVYHDFGMEFKKIMPGNLNGLPQEFLFDKNGELVYHKKRYSMGAEDILYNKIKDLAE